MAFSWTKKHLKLLVSNTGELSGTSISKRGVGYGLEGLRQRLKLHYSNRASLTLEQKDGWVTAAVLLPLR